MLAFMQKILKIKSIKQIELMPFLELFFYYFPTTVKFI